MPDISNLIELSKLFNVSLDKLLKNDICEVSLLSDSINLDYEECLEFLVEAKKNTYAGNGKVLDKSSRLGSKDLEYAKGDYKYYDTYLGGENFIGEEALFYKDKPIWGMNYYGIEYPNYSRDFLKKALMTVSKNYPYRGMPLYKDGDYTYVCNVSGSFEYFNGIEYIYLKDQLVFTCSFNGGLIK